MTRVIGGLWENMFRSAGDSNVCPVTLTHATEEASPSHYSETAHLSFQQSIPLSSQDSRVEA